MKKISRVNLINRTDWDSRDLKKLVLAVYKAKGLSHVVYLYVLPTRSSCVHGLASVGGNMVKMFLPRTDMYDVNSGKEGEGAKWERLPWKFKVDSFARVLEHEFDHNLGLRHKDMCGVDSIDVGYVEGFEVKKKVVKEKSKVDLVEVRRCNAERKVKELESKLKRTQNLLKKWNSKLKYYVRKEVKKGTGRLDA